VNTDLEIMSKEAVVALFKILYGQSSSEVKLFTFRKINDRS
jgi:hypothetical protein